MSGSNIMFKQKPRPRPKGTDNARSGEAFPKPVTHAKLNEMASTKKSGRLNIS